MELLPNESHAAATISFLAKVTNCSFKRTSLFGTDPCKNLLHNSADPCFNENENNEINDVKVKRLHLCFPLHTLHQSMRIEDRPPVPTSLQGPLMIMMNDVKMFIPSNTKNHIPNCNIRLNNHNFKKLCKILQLC